ncbi:hypothetical protein HPB47_005466, partial [Ixodes persulcatus]
ESKSETYERMWQAMSGSLVDSNADGVSRVQAGGYAFLMESTTIEYVVERHCQLTQVGGLLDSKGYGIAMPAGSPYRRHLSAAILRLQEDGTMQMLKNRWWKVGPRQHCPEDSRLETSRPGSASELGLAKVGGVFVVLLGGLGIACIIAFVEFFCKARSSSKTKHRSLRLIPTSLLRRSVVPPVTEASVDGGDCLAHHSRHAAAFLCIVEGAESDRAQTDHTSEDGEEKGSWEKSLILHSGLQQHEHGLAYG